MSYIIPISFSLLFHLTSATPTLLSFASFSEAIALSDKTAKLSNDVLSGVVAKCARIDAGICLIKTCRITALPTTAVVPNPAVFCRRRRKRKGVSVPSFSPDMTLLTCSGVVKPRLSINTPLRLMYLWLRNGCNKISLSYDATSPDKAAQVSLYRSSSSIMSWRSNWVSSWLNHNSTSFP